MALDYFRSKKKSKADPSPAMSPVLNDEEEKFLERIVSEGEGTPPPLPDRPVVILDNGKAVQGRDAQTALMDGAEQIALPTSPPVDSEGKNVAYGDGDDNMEKDKGKEKETDEKKKKNFMTYFSTVPGRFKSVREKNKEKSECKGKEKEKEKAAKDLHSAAENAKTSEEEEAEKEKQDLSQILDQLNLSAVNNRVFSFSKESQELLEKFKLVLKDIVNGAPTAYNDLEKLLTDSESQLKKMHGSLPPFIQNLIKSLPTKISAALAPELMAAASEKPGFDAQAASGVKKSKRAAIPSLKKLVASQGAVTTMLRSILNFLKLRFPALLTGTNVLMSLAVFILLFVFWYCHKRGRETRLEKERLATEGAEGGEASTSRVAELSESESDLEASAILNEKTQGNRELDGSDPPLIMHESDEAGDRHNATVDDMPSVLHLPDPASVPLPPEGTTPLREKEAPLLAK